MQMKTLIHLPHKVKQVLSNFNTDNLRKYPASDASELKLALSKAYNINENQIFMGNWL